MLFKVDPKILNSLQEGCNFLTHENRIKCQSAANAYFIILLTIMTVWAVLDYDNRSNSCTAP